MNPRQGMLGMLKKKVEIFNVEALIKIGVLLGKWVFD